MKCLLLGLVAALVGTSIHLGFLLGSSDSWAADALPIALNALLALFEFVGVALLEPWLVKREQRDTRKFDADKELFRHVVDEMTEEIMAYFSSACAEATIDYDAIAALCVFEESYKGKIMKRFHCRKVQEEFEAFQCSLKEFTEFTSVNLYPVDRTSNLSLRQGVEGGIEYKDRAEFQRRIKLYDEHCEKMISAYRAFVECGKSYFG